MELRKQNKNKGKDNRIWENTALYCLGTYTFRHICIQNTTQAPITMQITKCTQQMHTARCCQKPHYKPYDVLCGYVRKQNRIIRTGRWKQKSQGGKGLHQSGQNVK